MSTLLLALGLTLIVLSSTSVSAQDPEIDPSDPEAQRFIRNPSYEEVTNSSHLPPWSKAKGSPGIIYAEQSAPHSGGWNGALEPLGSWLAMRQRVLVASGRVYRLTTWVSTSNGDSGHPANLVWNTNVSGDRVCAYSLARWATYSHVECWFDVPDGVTKFLVKLKSNAPNGQWVVVDDWKIEDWGRSEEVQSAQALGKVQGEAVFGANSAIYTGQPDGGSYFVAGFVGVCNQVPCSVALQTGYYEVGFAKGTWTGGQLKPYVSWKESGSLGGTGRTIDNLTLNEDTRYNFEVRFNDATQEWEAYVGGILVDHRALGFVSSQEAACGAEGAKQSPPINPILSTQCASFKIKGANGTWQSRDFNVTKTQRNNCVTKTGTYGWKGWGPC